MVEHVWLNAMMVTHWPMMFLLSLVHIKHDARRMIWICHKCAKMDDEYDTYV